VEELLTSLGYVIGAITVIGGLIALGILVFWALAGIWALGAWIVDGIRD
jgi:hypothetical protein